MTGKAWIANGSLVLSIVLLIGAVVASPLVRGSGRDFDTPAWTVKSGLQRNGPLSPIPLETLDGDTVILGETVGWPALVVEYRTTCPHCERSRPQWQRLAAGHVGLCERGVVFVSNEPLMAQRAYWEEWEWGVPEGCAAPVIGRPPDPRGFVSVFNSPGVPSHHLLNTNGAVTHTWIGAVGASSGLRAFSDSIRQ